MNDDLPTEFWISAQIRLAAREGVIITVLHHGDDARGAILLKINRLDGFADVLSQLRLGDEVVWAPVAAGLRMTIEEADIYIERQINYDPDLWAVEVEDREGRPWFPGKIVEI